MLKYCQSDPKENWFKIENFSYKNGIWISCQQHVSHLSSITMCSLISVQSCNMNSFYFHLIAAKRSSNDHIYRNDLQEYIHQWFHALDRWPLHWYWCHTISPLFFNTKDKITRQIWGIWKLRPAYSPETPNLGKNRWCFVPCDLEIWWMTLDNNRAPLLCCFKLCATFHSHRWIQTGVADRKRPIWVKFDDF